MFAIFNVKVETKILVMSIGDIDNIGDDEDHHDGCESRVMVFTVLKMLTRTRKRVIRRAIRPGITSGGTTKLIQDTTTNKPAQNNCDDDEIKTNTMIGATYEKGLT